MLKIFKIHLNPPYTKREDMLSLSARITPNTNQILATKYNEVGAVLMFFLEMQ